MSHLELVIQAMSVQEADAFKQQLSAQGDVQNVVLKSYEKGTATFELDVKGCECDLPAKIARIPNPGFRYEGRATRIRYTAFDNQPPQVAFVFPENGRVFTDPEQMVSIEVPDADVDKVTLNDVPATRFKGSIFRAKVRLHDGPNELVASARDKAGNVATSAIKVALTPASPVQAIVRVWVEGIVEPGSSVMVGGREVPVDGGGRYKAEVPIRKGQTDVEIIAIDRYGNKTVTMRAIGE